ncbi:MAG TPA: GH32 C-terminal domain-containing protein, partial [Gemmataceae bacterium]|nr:GH32 C-terminal domain-containing protein [Gemmataceae bacterium]
PVELTLRTTPEGTRMFAEPVKEIASLHHDKHQEKSRKISDGEHVLPVKADLLHIVAEFEPGDAREVEFLIHGVPVRYDAKKHVLSCRNIAAPLSPRDGKITMEILVDRGSIEVFGNKGRVAISSGRITAKDNRSLKIVATGGTAMVRNLVIHEMRSAWDAATQRQK